MSPENLTTDTGMTRREIDLARKMAIYEAKEDMRRETAEEIAGVREEVQAIGVNLDSLREEGRATAATVDRKMDQLLDNQELIKKKQDDLEDRVKGVENLSFTVEEVQDGRRVIKKFRTWGDSLTDVKLFSKKFWVFAGSGWAAYHVIGAWLSQHGVSWAQMFTDRK